jgi:hypothetical protein
MLWWRKLIALGGLLAVTAGCQSAHIKDAYISRDQDGVRKTACIQPQWQSYYMVVELMSFSEDTLFWPYLICEGGDCAGLPLGGGGVLAPPWLDGDEELVQFGNMAPGKTETNIAIEFKEFTIDEKGQRTVKDLTPGRYRWDLYIDDENTPRESVPMDIAPGCPCVGTVVGNC